MLAVAKLWSKCKLKYNYPIDKFQPPYMVPPAFNYEIVQLNQLNWRDFSEQKNPIAAALMAKMEIAP